MTRSDFEQWALANYPDSKFERYESGFYKGNYKSVATQCRWEGYQGDRVEAEPIGIEYQHEDTGQIGYIDTQQVEWGFFENNPRLQEIGPIYRAPQPAKAVPEWMKMLEDECWDLRCITESNHDDADIAWVVIEHYMDEPKERIIGYGKTPKAAMLNTQEPKE